MQRPSMYGVADPHARERLAGVTNRMMPELPSALLDGPLEIGQSVRLWRVVVCSDLSGG